jgi:sulfur carrier protein ThiS adenylyltransferase
VELKNIGTQGWNMKDMGEYKSNVLLSLILAQGSGFGGSTLKYEDMLGDKRWPTPDVFFGCVDTMAARGAVFRKILKVKGKNLQGLLLDSRMRSRIIRLVTVDLASAEDREYYLSSLFADSEADEGLCTDRMTIYGAYMAAGMMVSQLVNSLRGMPLKRDFVVDTSVMQLNEIAGQ